MHLSPASTATLPTTRDDALAAPVRDPLWFLARQWQTRGFIADDAGTPVHVQLASSTAALHLGASIGPAVTAIEPLVEPERLPTVDDLDHAGLVGLASELARRLRAAGAPTARTTLAHAFPFAPTDAGPTIRPFSGRLPDPRPLYHLIVPALGPAGDGSGHLPAIPGLPPAQVGAVETACRGWLAWLAPRLAPTPGNPGDDGHTPAAWDPERLEYRFALGARLPGGALTLPADEYDGAGVEWHTFDDAGVDPGAGPHGPATPAPVPAQVRPTPVAYAGMPRPRFWELEDGHVNLDTLAATDAAHAVLVAFAHQYANDWFMVPLRVSPGVTTLDAFTVVDTFGETTEIPAVATVDGGRGPWRMWDLTATGDHPAATGARLLVPPTPVPASGEVLEDVLVARDELANLAWVIERTTRDADGRPVDRFQRHLRLRPPADPAFDPGDRPDGRDRYRLGTAVPDFWYPLVTTTGPGGRPLLARAALPPGATGVPDDGVRGTLVPHAATTAIADEEVPREGAHVTRQDRLLTGAPGGPAVIVWRARTKTPGLGEASSGLRFDTLA